MIVTGPGYKEIRKVRGNVTFKRGDEQSLPKVKILFEECFFNPNDESYQVLCLDQPLEGGE